MTSPVVIQTPGWGQELQQGLAPFLEALMQKQVLDLKKEDLKLRQGEFKLAQEESAFEQQQTTEQARIQEQAGQLLQALMTASLTPEVPMPVGMNQGLPVMAPVQPDVAGIVGRAPPAAVAKIAPQAEKIINSIAATRANRQRMAMIEGSLGSITDPEVRKRATAYTMLQMSGVDVPVEMAKSIWPEMFPEGMTPEKSNAMVRAMAGGMTYGQARSLVDAPPNASIPDSYVLPITARGSGMPSDKRATAGMHFAAMSATGDMIEQLEAETGGISLPGEVYRSLLISGGTSLSASGLVGSLVASGINWSLSEQQQRLVSSEFQFTNAYRYLVSGQQTSDREFGIILRSIMGNFGDRPEVVAQKQAFRRAMRDAAGRMARGELAPVDAVKQLQSASNQLLSPNLPAEERAALEGMWKTQLQDAMLYERTDGTGPINLDTLQGALLGNGDINGIIAEMARDR